MKPVVTARQMRAIDEETIRDHVPGPTLMERAGAAVANEIADRYLSARPRPRIVVVCGKGNNGGDGFVVARLLKQRLASSRSGRRRKAAGEVSVYLVGKPSEVKGDALINLKRCRRAGIKVVELGKASWKSFEKDLEGDPVVVDAIFGTGFEGEPRGLAAEAIEAVNRSGGVRVAVDIPSGVDATTASAALAVKADLTVTMGLCKRGHLFYPGKALTGELAVADIGIPSQVVERAGLTASVPEADDIEDAVPVRPPEAHKWTCGHVACICGSTGLTGAAALTSEAALRIGAGLVTLAVPRSLNAIMEVKLTEVMTLPVDETPAGSFSLGALDALRGLVGRADCVALGPGLSLHPETVEVVRELIAGLDRPCVLDADGINAFTGRADLLTRLAFPLIITPHAGEAARLFGVDKSEIVSRRIDFVAEKALELRAVIVLKGAPTVVAGPDGLTFINPTGNEGLATAGSGDVLTGIIAGLVAQGVHPRDAAYVGVYIHGECGDLLAHWRGKGFLAGEIATRIPDVMRLMDRGPDGRAGLRRGIVRARN